MCKALTWTTLTTNMRDMGRESRIMNSDTAVITSAQTPGPSSHSEKNVRKSFIFVRSKLLYKSIIYSSELCRIKHTQHVLHLQKNEYIQIFMFDFSPPRFSWLDFFLKNPMMALIWCLGPHHARGWVFGVRLRE